MYVVEITTDKTFETLTTEDGSPEPNNNEVSVYVY